VDSNQSSSTQLPWDYLDKSVSVALTGKAFHHALQMGSQNPFMLNSILAKAKVYARMSPSDKALLVEALQKNLKIFCGMCGDGANDCGALKTAAVGISLSEAEASIAAPFTSRVQDIRCVVSLLREGKAAIVTSFQAFKFIELYSVIQLTSAVFLYTVGTTIMDMQFLYIDLVALVPLAIVQATTGSSDKLTKDMPTATLFYFPVLLSVIVSIIIQIGTQVFFFLDVRKQPFYGPIDAEDFEFGDATPCYEGTVLFMVANAQYFMTCLAFSVAWPFRKPWWTNRGFVICIILIVAMEGLILFLPHEGEQFYLDWAEFFGMIDFPDDYNYRFWILLGIVVNSIVTVLAEKFIVNVITKKWDERNDRIKA